MVRAPETEGIEVRTAVFLSLVLSLALSFPVPVSAQPPQHANYELASDVSLPPWQRLILSWVMGNMSNSWGYLRLFPSFKLERNLSLFFVSGLGRRVLWKVDSFDFFDCEGWSQSTFRFEDISLRSFALGDSTFFVELNKSNPHAYVGILPHPTSNQSVVALNVTEGGLSGYLTDYGSLVVVGNASGSTLQFAISYSPPEYNSTLIAFAERSSVPGPFMSKYTSLPSELPPELIEITDELKGESLTMAEQAAVISEFLSGFEYLSDITGENVSGSPVSWFLKRKGGDSSLFATTFVLISRCLGIPSRFIVGFRPENVSKQGCWIRTSDLYAWTELYFPDVGWVPIDPTPSGNKTEDVLPLEEMMFNTTIPTREKEGSQPLHSPPPSNATSPSEVGENATRDRIGAENETYSQLGNESMGLLAKLPVVLREWGLVLLLMGIVALIALPAAYFSKKRSAEEGVKMPREGGLGLEVKEGVAKALKRLNGLTREARKYYESSRYKEGVVFLGETFPELTFALLDLQKEDWETHREFFVRFLYSNHVKGESRQTALTFVELFERAMYSSKPMGQRGFLGAVKSFSALLDAIYSSLRRRGPRTG